MGGRVAIAGLCLLCAACAPEQQFALLGDLRLESGEVLRDCRVGYRVAGRLDASGSNAVLVTTWNMGTTRDMARQLGPGLLVDSARYFVVSVDALGNGVSSSPSNSPLQPGSRFPRITIRDMVESQYLLATRVLGLARLRAVVGVSMGGMQALQWAAAHPGFAGKTVSIVGTPRATPGDQRRWRRRIEEARTRAEQPPGALERWLPQALRPAPADPEDYARQAEAIIGHDVAASFGGSLERAAASLRGGLLIVLSPRDDVVEPAPSLELARLAGARLLTLDGRCGHAAPSCDRDTLRPAVARFLAE